MWDIHLYVVALRGFSLGNQAFPRACEQGHLYKPATRPARRIGQGKTFPRPIFLAGFISSRKLTQLGLQTSLCIKGFEVFRWKEITFTFTWNHNIYIFFIPEGAGWTGSGPKTADSTSWKTGERKHTRQSQAEATAGCCEKAWERQEILNSSMFLLTAKIYLFAVTLSEKNAKKNVKS